MPRQSAEERSLFLAAYFFRRRRLITSTLIRNKDLHARFGYANNRRFDLRLLGKSELQPIEVLGTVATADPDAVIAGGQQDIGQPSAFAQQPVANFYGFRRIF